MDEEVMVMALCEYTKVFLRPNQLYRFEVVEGCNSCKELDVYNNEKE